MVHQHLQRTRVHFHEMLIYPLLIEFHLFEIFPDAFVICAIVTTTDRRTIRVHRATAGLSVYVRAKTIHFMTDEIRRSQIPSDFSTLDLRTRQGKIELATDCFANVHALRAVHLNRLLFSLNRWINSYCDADSKLVILHL